MLSSQQKRLKGPIREMEEKIHGTSLVVQWLRLRASTEGGAGLISCLGTKIPHATLHGRNPPPPKKIYEGGLRQV